MPSCKQASEYVVVVLYHSSILNVLYVFSLHGKAILLLFHPQAKKNCEFQDYDTLVKELIFDRTGKAKAVEKLKTPEQLVIEERERLLALEADRVRRMKGEKPGKGAKPKSADDLDDG